MYPKMTVDDLKMFTNLHQLQLEHKRLASSSSVLEIYERWSEKAIVSRRSR